MILKSLGHKTRSFGKLVAYVARGAEAGRAEGHAAQDSSCSSFSRNLMGAADDLDAVTRAFEENARFLRPRQGGNWCYHEIIALPKAMKEKTRESGEAVLFELAEAYVAKRAPRQLVWGRVHWETEHPHLHLVISANEVRSPRRVRVPRPEFTKLVEELEAFKCARWPDLPEKLWQHRKRYNRQRRTHAEEQVARRTGRVSQRSELAETLTALFAKARWPDDLDQSLAALGLKLYRRGRAWGVIDLASGKRHRLRSLGLLEAFRAMSDRILSQEQRLGRLMNARACDQGRVGGRERTREPLAPSQ